MTEDEHNTGAHEDDRSPDEPSLVTRQRQLRTSPGYRALVLIERLKRISYIFQANVAHYRALVDRLQDPDFSIPIMDVRNPQAHDDLLSEAERLLHNVLMAMSTRIDQQRVFMKKHFGQNDALTEQYEERIAAAFAKDPHASFLKGLRNHITHHQLPVGQSQQTFTQHSWSITFVLPSAPLLDWDWNGSVREWITNCGDGVAIADVVEGYARQAAEFDAWLTERIAVNNAVAIQAFQDANEDYTREYDRVFGF